MSYNTEQRKRLKFHLEYLNDRHNCNLYTEIAKDNITKLFQDEKIIYTSNIKDVVAFLQGIEFILKIKND